MSEWLDANQPPMSLVMFLMFLFIGCFLFEVILLGIAFFGADKVECNLLWCEFTTVRSYGTSNFTRYCSENGELINCSLYDKKIVLGVFNGS